MEGIPIVARPAAVAAADTATAAARALSHCEHCPRSDSAESIWALSGFKTALSQSDYCSGSRQCWVNLSSEHCLGSGQRWVKPKRWAVRRLIQGLFMKLLTGTLNRLRIITDESKELHFLGMIIAYSINTLSKKYYKRNINFKNV